MLLFWKTYITMADTSSDEEDYSKLLQAADYQFISDDLFKESSAKAKTSKLWYNTIGPSPIFLVS